MAKVLNSISLDSPASPVVAVVNDTFTLAGTPGFSGSAGVQRYDIRAEVNPGGAGWVAMDNSSTGLRVTTNPFVSNSNSTSQASVTVTCAVGGSYTVRLAGAPTSGGSFTVFSATQTVSVATTQSGSLTANATLRRLESGSAAADAVLRKAISGSFTANASLVKTTSGSFTANAVVKRTQAPTFPVDADLRRTQSGSATADAVRRVARSGAVSADAGLLRAQQGSLATDADLHRTISASFTEAADLQKTQSGVATGDAIFFKTIETWLTIDAEKLSGAGTVEASFSAEAITAFVGVPTWISPADDVPITSTPTLVFTIPASIGKIWFNIQLDKVDTFDSVDLRDVKTTLTQEGWEFFDGADWQPVPADGIPHGSAGQQARFAVTPSLPSGDWYRRIRAGTTGGG